MRNRSPIQHCKNKTPNPCVCISTPHSTATPVLAAAAALGNLGYHHDINRCSIVNAGGAALLPVAASVLLCACS